MSLSANKTVAPNDAGSSNTAPLSNAPSRSPAKKRIKWTTPMVETLLHLRHASEANRFAGINSTRKLADAWEYITHAFNLTHNSSLSKGQLQTKHEHLRAECREIQAQMEEEPNRDPVKRYNLENLPEYWETMVECFGGLINVENVDFGQSETPITVTKRPLDLGDDGAGETEKTSVKRN
ncbi:hypothetical protein HDU81_001703 [Chytriomyces hyalinus]|nr:hypothetical protein HDU81_001703 [Chytriomyces hyalinus]